MHCRFHRRLLPQASSLRCVQLRLTRPSTISPAIHPFSSSLRAISSKMGDTSFVLEDYNNVPVTASDVAKDELKEWGPFKNWISTLTSSLALQSHPSHPFHKNPYSLKHITIDSTSKFGHRIGFLKLTASISTTDATSRLPGVVLLRGPSVAMLVVLVPDDADRQDEAYVVLTVQPRIAAGSLGFVELPAGMLDDQSNFAGAAAKEMEEELGLVISREELTCLTDRAAEIKMARRGGEESGGGGAADQAQAASAPSETLPFAMFPSAGGCDEYVKIFAHERRVPRETLREWEGKYGGLRDHGEMITLKLVPLRDLWLEGGMDSKALAAVTMYKELKRWDEEQGRS